ncbi:hypothetical protein FS749_010164 [Ceratobasidium sp. UAMH 11750]|nr:hypothetical protein FS749_010164 [Ceratobasidium sp. UAMH 11750]
MNRHFRRLDGTIPVAALLYEDEELVASQDSVGLYDGKEKTPEYQNGTAHITTHRLIYVDAVQPRKYSTACNLSRIKQTDVYAGFLKSSPKVILMLSAHDDPTPDDDTSELVDATAAETPMDEIPSKEGWVCPICSYNNPASASESAPVCVLCGVPKNDDIPMPQQFKSSRPALAIPTTTSATSSSLPSSSSMPAAPSPTNGELACPACTFFNHPSMTHCEICSTPLGDVRLPAVVRSPKPSKVSSVSSPTTPARTPDPNARDMFKISFRKGGDKVWYAALKRTLLARAWARVPTSKVALPSTQARGIHGILQLVEINAQTTHDDMEDALKDLEALMSKAREMTDYAKLLNMKLTQQEQEDQRRKLETGYSTPDTTTTTGSHAPSDSETTFIRSSLARLGLPTDAVTQDMVADERAYHTELAKELGGLLLGGGGGGPKGKDKAFAQRGIMEDSRGIVGLDEVWGAWNRARGVALLPPSTLLTVVPLLPNHTTPPIHMRTLRSGLRVLHTPDYTREAFAKRLDQSLCGCFPLGQTTFQVAAEEGAGVSLAMVQEMVECAEEDGAIARDEVGGEVRWLPNLFVGYMWDGD